MPRNDATPKQTGGGGHNFEDEVVAYFLAHMLAGRPPFEHLPTQLIRLDSQEPASKWHLDDIVLTLGSLGDTSRVAISVKSNAQFSSAAFPSDFVRDAWEQLLRTTSDAFDEDRDWLGFITAPAPRVQADLNTLLDRARQQSATDLADDLHRPRRANDTIRSLHDSAACPEDFAQGQSNVIPGRLLRRLVWMPFDLDHAPSERRSSAKRLCQDLLLSGTPEDAERLWQALTSLAAELRETSGDIDRPQLVAHLRAQFTFRGFPEHRGDWQRLHEATSDSLNRIPHKIGGRVLLPRQHERKRLQDLYESNSVVAILGASGVGKTVIARAVAQEMLDSGVEDPTSLTRVIWTSAESLQQECSERLRLGHSIVTLLKHDSSDSGLLVLDRLDYLHSTRDFEYVASLLHAVGLMEGPDPMPLSRWRVLATCTPEAWDRVKGRLLHYGVAPATFATLPIEEPSSNELEGVWHDFPLLRPLRLRRHLAPILLRPKILDLLASKTQLDLDLSMIGESHLATWFWEREILSHADGLDRSLAATTLARIQADELTPNVRIAPSEFDPGTREALGDLESDHILTRHYNRVGFEHDLYGDWVRLHILREEAERGQLPSYLSQRMTSPIWQRAVRLFGLCLLEQHGPDAWHRERETLEDLGDTAALARDLLLEASAHSVGSTASLTALWPLLAENDGVLLERLLRRLLHSATLPDPAAREQVTSIDPTLEPYVSSASRFTYWPYWFVPLIVLHDHRQVIPRRAWGAVAQVVDLWLRYTEHGSTLRSEAAEIALALGEALIKEKRSRTRAYGDGDTDRAVYRAVLAASTEFEDEALTILLEAGGLREPRLRPPSPSNGKNAERRDDSNQEKRPVPPLIGPPTALCDPWPDGPSFRVDEALQHVVLETDALNSLIEVNPRAARELLLALVIEAPRETPYGVQLLHNYGLEVPRWGPPFYSRGPFLAFLTLAEGEGVEAILRLVDHVTNRWVEHMMDVSHRPDEPTLDTPFVFINTDEGEREYLGDRQTFDWHQDGPDSEGVITSALMALEKHLYNRIERGDDVTEVVNQLLLGSHSVAIIGLLTTVGQKKPALFHGPLRGFLTSPEILKWTNDRILINPWHWSLSEPTLPRTLREAFLEWRDLPHRRMRLIDIARFYFHNGPGFEEVFNEARRLWSKEVAAGGRYHRWNFVESLIAQFDRDNYEVKQMEDGQSYYVFQPPLALRQHADSVAKLLKDDLLILATPMQCREIIDGRANDFSLDELWSKVELAQQLDASDWERGPSTVRDSFTGIAAVIALHGQEWLTRNPERRRWVRQQLLEAVYLEPEDSGGVSYCNAPSFAADALPAFWAHAHDDVEIREAIARIAIAGVPKHVERLVAGSKQRRATLGDDHLRLIHLILRRARLAERHRRAQQRIRHLQYRADTNGEHNVLAAELKQLEAESDKLARAFVNGSLAATVPSFAQLSADAPPPRHPPRSPDKRYRNRAWLPLDDNLLVAAYKGFPLPNEAELYEWERWSQLWRGALYETVEPLTLPDDVPTVDIEGPDGSWEKFLWRQVAQLVAECVSDAEAQEYWQPVLALGPTASYAVSSFLGWWKALGADNFEKPQIVHRWNEMITFALGHPRWSGADRGESHNRAQLWRRLLGLEYLLEAFWPAERAPLVTSLTPSIAAWAENHMRSPDDIRALASFLVLPASEPIRLVGLSWIEAAARRYGDRLWVDNYIGQKTRFSRAEETVADLLLYIWTHHEVGLRRNPTAFTSFRYLLSVLAGRQLPLALELSERLGQGS